jgi:uncharacterized protein
MAPRFEAATPSGAVQVVQGYGAGGWRVSGVEFSGGVLITPERSVAFAATLDSAQADDFAAVLQAEPRIEILLIGTGATMRLLPKPLREALTSTGLAIDPMDSRAAARTYNVLLGEDRRVAALLLPI